MELAVIGREDFCLGFRLAGVRNVFETENPTEAIKETIGNSSIGVVIFDEGLALDEFDKAKIEGSVRPVFVMLSLNEESDAIRKMIKKSIGIEL